MTVKKAPTKSDNFKKPAPAVVQLLAANVVALQAARPALRSDGLLAKKARIDQKTVWRTIRKETAIGIDKLARIAEAGELKPWQMLVPNLDPKAPPRLVSEVFGEQISDAARHLGKLFDSLESGARKQQIWDDLVFKLEVEAARVKEAAISARKPLLSVLLGSANDSAIADISKDHDLDRMPSPSAPTVGRADSKGKHRAKARGDSSARSSPLPTKGDGAGRRRS